MKTARLATLGVAVWALAGCGSSDAPAAPSALATPSRHEAVASPTPTPTPIASAAAEGPCPSRTTEMSLEEANRVAAHPTTGETWLPNPIAIEAPAAAVASGNWDVYAEWFEVGARADRAIYVVYSMVGSGMDFIEVAPDGALTWIARPFPSAEEAAGMTHDGLDNDSEQCYESLALPTVVSLPDGTSTETHSTREGFVSYAQYMGVPMVDAQVQRLVRRVGGTDLYRLSTPSLPAVVRGWDLNQGTGLPDFEGVRYGLRLPFGSWLALPFNPLRDAATQVGVDHAVDFFDMSCGTPGEQALVPEGPDADWTVVGTSGGRDVAIPTASNPYAIERYDAYVQMISYSGASLDAAMSFEEYLALPGLVALRADEGGWWVGLNQEVSPRMWC